MGIPIRPTKVGQGVGGRTRSHLVSLAHTWGLLDSLELTWIH